MYDLGDLYRLRNAMIKDADPETQLVGRLINTILIAKEKKELDQLSEVIYKWLSNKTT